MRSAPERQNHQNMSSVESRGDLSGSEYLQQVLGDVLAKALSSVARERPQDPVQYVAEYLYKVSGNAWRTRVRVCSARLMGKWREKVQFGRGKGEGGPVINSLALGLNGLSAFPFIVCEIHL